MTKNRPHDFVDRPPFDAKRRSKALKLTDSVGIYVDEQGAFLMFGATSDEPDREAYYELADLWSDDLTEVAESLLWVAEQLSVMEMLNADAAGNEVATVDGPTIVQ